jgi:D-alanine-D-alanine ligase
MSKQLKPAHFGKVAVLAGGLSNERDISLMSGRAVFNSLIGQGVDAHFIDVSHDIIEQLQTGKFDCAFIALHGQGGEDGVIQGLLEVMQIPYTGSGVMASALAMDKLRSKIIWQSVGLPILPSVIIDKYCNLQEINLELQFPVAVKPVDQGSSFGVSKAQDYHDLPKMFEKANQYSDLVMLEEWVEGSEFTVGILHDGVLPPLEIRAPDGFYSYEAKYKSHATTYHCPCDLKKNQQAELQEIAVQAFDALGCRGWGCVDFKQDKEGNFWILEINTVPGLTGRSNIPIAARAADMEFDELVMKILSTSLETERFN